MKYLLDTCVVSELIRKRPCEKVTTWVARHDETGLFLSVVTIGELQKGISKLPAARKRQQLQTWFDHHLYRRFSGRIIKIDEHVAETWGNLSAEAEKKGYKIPVLDGLIAATARVHGLTVVTRNTKDMLETGVRLIDPWTGKIFGA